MSPYYRVSDALERAVSCANMAAEAAEGDHIGTIDHERAMREALLSLAWSAIAREAHAGTKVSPVPEGAGPANPKVDPDPQETS